ncbi:hypothetical protein D9615_001282 [Tricholomella constricta]|uniref:GCN5-related N-acetyltransferase Rv2170-like domain-containing protein n=1 Tax=Tricholomella constricta TaxID=117010 RepID=A0A8H5M8Z9_9AGAR|nr:hypothetical protein D9615_001282 [Tricholomella constricta]
MPAVLSKISTPTINVCHSASSLPCGVWNAFKSDPRNSNIIYSHALRATQAAESSANDEHLEVWIICSTGDEIDFVLSCTHHAMGEYPIFIFCARPCSDLVPSFVVPRIQLLANALHSCVDVERVYSVFALDLVSRIFADTWSHLAQVRYYHEPYYAAKITFCTRRTLRVRKFTTLPDVSYDMRLAVASDIPATAKLCYGFASEAVPFVLTMEQATKEATLLTSRKQLWVHTIEALNKPSEIASIVAVTRESETVAAITKVYTNPDWRSRRCAERLVRNVTQNLLKTKESVVLYVAHNNPAASKVYDRVGFAGLAGSSLPVNGVDSWLEVGFDRDMIDLGHW